MHQVAAGRPVRRILDVGSGTGNGALALARQFPGAEVIAVDESGDLLARLRATARDRGLDDRVQTVEADLDQAWPAVGPVDVTWTSMALHHLADPDRALREIFAATRPGGLLAAAESTAPMRFLPDDIGLGRPGLEARAQAAVAEHHSGTMPYLGADWGPLVARAGFTGVAERAFGIELGPPLPAVRGPLRPGLPAARPRPPGRRAGRRRPGHPRRADRRRRARQRPAAPRPGHPQHAHPLDGHPAMTWPGPCPAGPVAAGLRCRRADGPVSL